MPSLAGGPCCCGRFFVVGHDLEAARRHAEAMAEERKEKGMAPKGYEFRVQQIALPWGGTVEAISANLRG